MTRRIRALAVCRREPSLSGLDDEFQAAIEGQQRRLYVALTRASEQLALSH